MESPRSLLAGRFRFVGAFEPSGPSPRWLALDERTGRPVAVGVVPPHQTPGFVAQRGERHPHLAAVLDVVTAPDPPAMPEGRALEPGEAVVVAEHVQGQTLQQLLEEEGPLPAFKAVAWALRLASGLMAWREHGTALATLSPRTVVVDPKRRVIGPVITYFTAPPLAAFLTPECLKGSPPAPEDDVWAAHAVLYAMLTGRAPFGAATAEELVRHMLAGSARPLHDHGLREPLLQEVLAQGLYPSQRQRTTTLDALVRALDAWERGLPMPRALAAVGRIAPRPASEPDGRWRMNLLADERALPSGDGAPPLPEPVVPSTRLSTPAPAAPPSVAPSPLSRPAGPPPRPRRLLLWGAAGAMVAAGVGAALVLGAPDEPGTRPPSALKARTPAPAPTPSTSLAFGPRDDRAACIRAYFDPGAFPGGPKLDFVCGDDDFRDVARRLHALAFPPPAADAGAEPEVQDGGLLVVRASGRDESQQLGWYELVTAAVARKSCCAQATSVTLPRTRGNCLQLQTIVRSIAEASQNVGDVTHATREFEDAVACLYSAGVERPYAYEALPTDGNRRAFQRFLQHAAESEAKRSTVRR